MPVRSSKNKPEILAPAGDLVSLQAAIQARCDAVYFGIAGFNMRRAASNFEVSDLHEISERCVEAGIKRYLTLNTIIYETEYDSVSSTLETAHGSVDAVICWDPAVINKCNELGIPFHVSTQASVSNSQSALFYKQLGATRIVPARECTLNDLKMIKHKSGMELEVFAHGAMCVSISGRCYLSENCYGKSGNRGECLQNCRREYTVTETQEGNELKVGSSWIMSARDLCTLPFIEQLCDAGMDSFKIEGRGRNAEYVKTVVSAYRTAVDAWAEGALTPKLKSELFSQVETVYNRGFSDGFYMGRPIAEYTDTNGSKATRRKEHVGIVTNYYRKVGVVEIHVQNNVFSVGDELMIQGPTTGVVEFTPSVIRQDERDLDSAGRGIVTLKLDEKARAGDKVFIMTRPQD